MATERRGRGAVSRAARGVSAAWGGSAVGGVSEARSMKRRNPRIQSVGSRDDGGPRRVAGSEGRAAGSEWRVAGRERRVVVGDGPRGALAAPTRRGRGHGYVETSYFL